MDRGFQERGNQRGEDAVPDNVIRWKWMVCAFTIALCSGVLVSLLLKPLYIQECFTNMDVVFLLDASESVGDRQFRTAKVFISEIVSFLKVNKENIQTGLVTFSDKQHVKFHLSDHQSSSDVQKAILDITYDKGPSTLIGSALNFVRTRSFVDSKGARLNADRTLIILTDGRSGDNVQIPAKKLLDTGVVIVCIGIGSYSETKLLHITSDKTLVFNVNSYRDFDTIKENLVKKVCQKTIR